MKIEVWSDVVCPWCYIGARNLERALASFAHADRVEVVWRSFELDPAAPAERPGTYVEHLARKYGIEPEEARERLAHLVRVGAEAGAELRFDVARPGNSFDAHRLLHLARDHGVQRRLNERFFAATFTEGLPIGDRDTLVRLAGEVGIPPEEARRALLDETLASDVRAEESAAHDLGVQGVPFFVFDRRLAVSGAQAPAVLLEVLDRAWTEASTA
jgi:predicted DsbA family dithiol-disulfide isomerase